MTTPTGGEQFNLGNAAGFVDINTGQASANLRSLGGQMRSFFQGTSQSLTNIGNQMTSFGTSLGIALAPAALGFKQGVSAAGSFQDTLTEIQARTGATVEEMDRVREKALELGADTVFSSQQSAEAFLQLLTAGMEMSDAMVTIDSVTRAAQASGEDLGKTADQVTNILSAMNLPVEEAANVVDLLNRAAASSPATMSEMAEAWQVVAGDAKNLGIEGEELSSILAILARNGKRGTEAGNQLKSMFTNMLPVTANTQKAWEMVGTSLFDADGKARDFGVVLSEIQEGMANLTDEERAFVAQNLAGSFGKVGFNALVASDGIEAMNQTLASQADIQTVADARINTFNGAITSLKGSMETLLITIFTPYIESMTPMVKMTTNMVNTARDWVSANQAIVQPMLRVLSTLFTMVPILIAGGQAFKLMGFLVGSLVSPLQLALIGFTALASLFSAFADMSQFTGQIRGIIQAFNEMDFVDAMRWMFTTFEDGSNVIGSFINVFASLTGLTSQEANLLGDTINQKIAPAVDMFVQAIGIVSRAYTAFFQTLRSGEGIVQSIISAIVSIGFSVGIPVENLIWFRQVVLQVMSTVQNSVTSAVNTITSFGSRIGEALSGIRNFFSNALSVASNFRNEFLEIMAQRGFADAIERALTYSDIQGSFGIALRQIGVSDAVVTALMDPLLGMFQRVREVVTRVSAAIRPLFTELRVFFGSLFGGVNTDQVVGVADSIWSVVSTVMKLTNPLGQVSLLLDGLFNISLFELALSGFEKLARVTTLFFQGINMGLGPLNAFKYALGNPGWMLTFTLALNRSFDYIRDVAIPTIQRFANSILPFFEIAAYRIGEWVRNNAQLIFGIGAFVGVIAAAIPIVSAIQTVIAGIGIAIAFLTSPITLVVAAIAAFAAAYASNFGGIRDFINGEIFPLFQRFFGFLGNVWEQVRPALSQLANWFLNDVIPQVGGIIQNSIIPLLRAFIGTLIGLWDIAQPALSQLGNWFLDTALPGIMSFISDVVLPIVQSLIDKLTRLWTDVSPFLLQLADWFLYTIMPQIISYWTEHVWPALQNFAGLLKDLWILVEPYLAQLYTWFITSALPEIMNFIEGPVTDAFNLFIGLLGGMWDLVSDGITLLRDNLERIFNGIIDNVIQPIIDKIQALVDKFNAAKDLVSGGLGAIGIGDGGVGDNPILPGQGGANPASFIIAAARQFNAQKNGVRQYATGTNYVPQDMLAFLHRGEAVVPAQYNPAAGGSGGSGGPVLQIDSLVIHANSAAEGNVAAMAFEQTVMARWREIN